MRKLPAAASSSNPGHQGPAPPNGDNVVVGRIKGPRGLRGELRVELLTDVETRFSPGSVLYLDGRPTRVERSRSVKGGLVVKLDTVNDRTAAESLRQIYLTIPASQVAPLPESAYYHFQIIDMGVWTDEGEFLGNVKEIIPTGSNDVYVVRDEERTETLVPALGDVVLEVDLERNRMTVRLP